MASPSSLSYSDIQVRARQAAAAALSQGPAAAARAAIAQAEAFLAQAVRVVGLASQMANLQCGAGCFTCCHQMVGVTVAELDLLRQAIAALPQPEREALNARIADIAAQGKNLNQGEWWAAKLRCPLLDEAGRCQVHAARPLPCRAMNSADSSVCRRSYEGETVNIPVLAAQHRIYGHAQLGLAEALAQAGLSPQPVVLGVALGE